MTRLTLLRELVLLIKLLYPKIKIHNPRERMIHVATQKQRKEIQQLAPEIVHAVTVINQSFRVRKGVWTLESTREDNLNALSLLMEQLNPGTLPHKGARVSYRVILRNFSEKTFSARQLREQTGYKKTETFRHINILQHYDLIEKTVGHRNKGYYYRIKNQQKTQSDHLEQEEKYY